MQKAIDQEAAQKPFFFGTRPFSLMGKRRSRKMGKMCFEGGRWIYNVDICTPEGRKPFDK
jgi:hypothetical protein